MIFSRRMLKMPPKFKVSPKADRTFDGITFDSKGEAKRYLELKLAEKAGAIKDFNCNMDLTFTLKNANIVHTLVIFRT